MNTNTLSIRVQDTLLPNAFMEIVMLALSNPYDPINNPDGIISLGIAENTLMYNDLASFLDKNIEITSSHLGYSAVAPGLPELKQGLLRLYNSDTFSPIIPVKEEDMYFTAGCTAVLDQLFWCLCDEGEGVLIGMPMYGGFANDLKTRSKAVLVPVSCKGYDPFGVEAVPRYEEELLKAEEKGIKVRVLVLCTPHNPLGQCYSREAMIEYMRLCQKYRIHLISDEIYALTTFPTDDIPDPTPFVSLLSIPKDNLIDPGLCHIIHGMSKDFCANGIRFGTLISQGNPHLHKAVASVGFFGLPSSLACLAFSTLLNDHNYLSHFLEENRQRLRENYHVCTHILKKAHIPYYPSNAGFFIWIDLSSYLHMIPGSTNLEKEREMTKRILDAGVYLATSEAFFGEENGWFRITFSVEKEVLELGMKRFSLYGSSKCRMIKAVTTEKVRPLVESLTLGKLKLDN